MLIRASVLVTTAALPDPGTRRRPVLPGSGAAPDRPGRTDARLHPIRGGAGRRDEAQCGWYGLTTTSTRWNSLRSE